MTGAGFAMKKELARLARKYGTVTPVPVELELLPECDGEQYLSGYASCPVIDLERTLFALGSLKWSPGQMPPLYHHHVPTPVGTVTKLEWTATGLRTSVLTNDPLAKRAPAFSVCATIHRFVTHDTGPDYYVEVLDARIDEISVVTRPANPSACVWERMPGCPDLVWYDLMSLRVQVLQKIVHLIMPQEQTV